MLRIYVKKKSFYESCCSRTRSEFRYLLRIMTSLQVELLEPLVSVPGGTPLLSVLRYAVL